jgi:SAM-dependent methyltransferase
MMTDEQIQQKIASFPTWLYQFNLRGHLTPAEDRHSDRHPWRKRHFFDPMVNLLGGSLAGKRVLDLACNAGYWSLAAIQAGADFVQGIEARQMHVDQANFVFEVNDIPPSRYNFATGNLFAGDLSRFGQFDIVLCLGIMYHITKHMPLLESISAINSDILLIDTRISLLEGAVLELRHEATTDPWHSADYSLVMDPTRQAIIYMVREFGYQAATLKPIHQNETGIDGYRQGHRRAFICAKKTDISRLNVPVE